MALLTLWRRVRGGATKVAAPHAVAEVSEDGSIKVRRFDLRKDALVLRFLWPLSLIERRGRLLRFILSRFLHVVQRSGNRLVGFSSDFLRSLADSSNSFFPLPIDPKLVNGGAQGRGGDFAPRGAGHLFLGTLRDLRLFISGLLKYFGSGLLDLTLKKFSKRLSMLLGPVAPTHIEIPTDLVKRLRVRFVKSKDPDHDGVIWVGTAIAEFIRVEVKKSREFRIRSIRSGDKVASGWIKGTVFVTDRFGPWTVLFPSEVVKIKPSFWKFFKRSRTFIGRPAIPVLNEMFRVSIPVELAVNTNTGSRLGLDVLMLLNIIPEIDPEKVAKMSDPDPDFAIQLMSFVAADGTDSLTMEALAIKSGVPVNHPLIGWKRVLCHSIWRMLNGRRNDTFSFVALPSDDNVIHLNPVYSRFGNRAAFYRFPNSIPISASVTFDPSVDPLTVLVPTKVWRTFHGGDFDGDHATVTFFAPVVERSVPIENDKQIAELIALYREFSNSKDDRSITVGGFLSLLNRADESSEIKREVRSHVANLLASGVDAYRMIGIANRVLLTLVEVVSSRDSLDTFSRIKLFLKLFLKLEQVYIDDLKSDVDISEFWKSLSDVLKELKLDKRFPANEQFFRTPHFQIVSSLRSSRFFRKNLNKLVENHPDLWSSKVLTNILPHLTFEELEVEAPEVDPDLIRVLKSAFGFLRFFGNSFSRLQKLLDDPSNLEKFAKNEYRAIHVITPKGIRLYKVNPPKIFKLMGHRIDTTKPLVTQIGNFQIRVTIKRKMQWNSNWTTDDIISGLLNLNTLPALITAMKLNPDLFKQDN